MPYIRIETNVDATAEKAGRLLAALIEAASAASGKPAAFFQTCFAGSRPMNMGGSAAPTAYVEYKAIGLAVGQAKPLSAAICGVLKRELDVPGERVYISFQSFDASMWGKDGTTFG